MRGELSFGSLYEEFAFEAASKTVILDYKRRTTASWKYELSDKLSFILDWSSRRL
jgi:hypothetical protein